jgi:hypothetical protein
MINIINLKIYYIIYSLVFLNDFFSPKNLLNDISKIYLFNKKNLSFIIKLIYIYFFLKKTLTVNPI